MNQLPLFTALRPRSARLTFPLFAVLLLLFPSLAARAQNPGMHPGQSDNFPVTGTSNSAGVVGNGQQSVGTWAINSPSAHCADSNTPNGWTVSFNPKNAGQGFSVTCPNNTALVGNGYVVSYCTSYKVVEKTINGVDSETETDSGPCATFDIANPPAKPGQHPGPAYDWEASAAGVNLANGNKLTSVPVVSWTQRGGLPVDFTLYHNSEAGRSAWLGPKWTSTDDALLSVSGSTATVAWGDGTTYSYAQSGGTFTCNQRGIHDTLTGSGSSYDITTLDQTKYHFSSFGNGLDLVSVTDRNGNAVSISRASGGQINSIQDCTGRKIALGYDSSGRINQVTDPINRVWTIGYDGNGNLSQVNLPLLQGQAYHVGLGYDGSHNVTSVTSPAGRTATALYNSDNSAQWVKDALGFPVTFGYTATQTTVSDANSHTSTYTFQYSTISSVTDPTNLTASTVYDINNALIQSTDRRGHSSSTTPDPHSGNRLNTIDADGNRTSALYQGSTSFVASATDGANNTTQYVYSTDGHFNLTQVLDPLGVAQNALTDYPAGWGGLPDWSRDANSHTTSFGYDNNPAGSGGYSGGYGIPTSATDPNGVTSTSHSSNALGWTDWSADSQQNKTLYTYDDWGRVTGVTAPDGTLTTTQYDPDGNVLSVNGGVGHYYVIRCAQGAGDGWGYDGGYSNSNAYVWPDSIDTSLVSNPAPQSVYQGERYAPDFTYSLPLTTPGLPCTVRLHFAEETADRPGDRVFNISINGQTVLANFDIVGASGARDRAVVREFAAKADANGNISIRLWHVAGADPNAKLDGIEILNRGVANAYDGDGRLTSTTDGRGDTVSYRYDEPTPNNGPSRLGLLTTKVDGNGHASGYVYTARDELAAVGYPDGGSEGWAYDENGNLHQFTRRDGTGIVYAYDNNNLLQTVTYPNPGTAYNVPYNAAATFTYDADNRRHFLDDGIGRTEWDYDADGRVTKLATPYNALTYTYDQADPSGNAQKGLLSWMAEGNVGSWRYSYDAGNRPTQTITPYNEVSGQTYDGDGRPYQQTAPNGAVTTLGYDALSRVTGVQWGVPGALGSINYDVCSYDPAGELVERDENGGSSTFYSYDGAGQLATEQRVGSLPYAAAYTYDGNANRLSKTLTDGSHTAAVDRYAYDAADRLLSVSGGILGNRAYTYTAAGEVRTLSQGGATWTLDWDASGHPYHTDYGNGAYSASAVNGLGQRVFSRTADGQSHYTVAAGAEPGSPLLSDMTGGGAGRVYTPGVGQHDLSTNASRFSLVDALGGSRALLGSDGSPLDDLRYDAWGGTIYHGGGSPAPVPLGWGSADGYQTDAWDSGLVLMGSRLYDIAVGRFLSPDPAQDGDNWYAYCQNDPINDSDPTGLTPTGAPMGGSFGNLGAQFDAAVQESASLTIYDFHKIIRDAKSGKVLKDTVLFSFALPTYVSLDHNYQAARDELYSPGSTASSVHAWYYNHVAPHRSMDYKDLALKHKNLFPKGSGYRTLLDNGGNFNYGVVGYALGLTLPELEVMAAGDHTWQWTKMLFSLHPEGSPFDDSESDTTMSAGYEWAKSHYLH